MMAMDTKSDEVSSTQLSELTTNNKSCSADTTEDTDLCPICSGPSISSCRNCKKISYCGKVHQRLHWKLHKDECFPLIHQYEQILGSRLIATRNIKAGEIIWREKPLLSGPNLTSANAKQQQQFCEEKARNSLKPMCLGCFRVVKSDYLCPSCSWPACGPTCCEQSSDHGRLECKIFTSHETTRSGEELEEFHLNEEGESGWRKYGAITVLRGVLLKEGDPSGWEKMLRLDEMWNGTEECDNSHQSSSLLLTEFGQFCHEFIMSFHLNNVTNQDIQLVLRVICYRNFSIYCDRFLDLEQTDIDSGMESCHLFYIANQATRNCVPNCSWIIHQDTNEIHLRALLPIQFGRTVTLSYANVTLDIIDRQATTTSSVPCECERCKDSELGTFYSAIKCPQEEGCHQNTTEEKKEEEGSCSWLLPKFQLKVQENGEKMRELMWKCHECGVTKSLNFYKQVVATINTQVWNVLSQTETCDVLIEKLEMLRNKHSNISVHSNHFTIFKIELNILRLISQKLSGGLLSPQIAERFTLLCRKWLELGDVLWPGLTRQRGELLYYYQQALALELILSISRRMRREVGAEEDEMNKDFLKIEKSALEKKFQKILNIRKVVLQVFCYDQSNSMGGKYAQKMVQKCLEIEILKRYVFPK